MLTLPRAELQTTLEQGAPKSVSGVNVFEYPQLSLSQDNQVRQIVDEIMGTRINEDGKEVLNNPVITITIMGNTGENYLSPEANLFLRSNLSLAVNMLHVRSQGRIAVIGPAADYAMVTELSTSNANRRPKSRLPMAFVGKAQDAEALHYMDTSLVVINELLEERGRVDATCRLAHEFSLEPKTKTKQGNVAIVVGHSSALESQLTQTLAEGTKVIILDPSCDEADSLIHMRRHGVPRPYGDGRYSGFQVELANKGITQRKLHEQIIVFPLWANPVSSAKPLARSIFTASI